MDIELARTFLAVVETGSFLDAADKVHVTQSTVSMRIKTLEEQLGHPVFERSKTGAKLTPAGLHFQRHAITLVRTWTQAKLDAALPAELYASLEIGAVPSLWDGFLIEAMPTLQESLPNVAIKATWANTEDLNRQIEDGALDLAIMYRPRNAMGLVALQLFEDELVLVSSDKDDNGDPFGTSYVFVDWGPEFRADHLLNFPDLVSPGLHLMIGTLGLQYLLSTPASGYFPRRIVEADIKRGSLRLIDDAPRFAYAVHAVFNKDQEDSFPGQAARHLQSVSRSLTIGSH
ncbi:LysR family transcriptional regulator [Loktanella sp. D2R18]|uniref:LysR family transcriptional regulator n=1 Tax=Rhodobacterales TaxID=204455 RepID=UPI000DEB5844|nr:MULTISPECIES: LysR family transcriptional regulator [Rhodobacterales]MDO6591739.1 LysR family transcriptional regulator [Yoonia sp. 1_MG-2023]RBW42339.1 LysR family transcriptional regulator [Loktanella sp. D2R18]